MNMDYYRSMSTETLQVRDVPAGDVEVLKARAAARRVSLSAYLRELIHYDAAGPTMGEVLARIAERESVRASATDIRSFIDGDRR